MTALSSLTVFGTGVMGSQIMMQAAYAGKTVVGYDISDEILETLEGRWEWMRRFYRRDLAGFTDKKFDEAISRITTTTSVKNALAAADIVIEAVPENLELKHKLWEQISAVDPGHAILTTNSSYFLPSEIAPSVRRSNRFAALHFATRVWLANIGESMGHDGTDPDVLDAIAQFGEEINLRVFRVRKEVRGYLLNAQIVPLIKEAARLYVNGVGTFDEINESFKVGLAAPTGVVDTFDSAGFNVFHDIFANDEDPSLREFANVMKIGIANGKTGLGDGEGFYTYAEDGRKTGLSNQIPPVWEI
ncbi:3-hydroxyacyl-CoA dehydrogenase NAD-binding domain-containing protein [Rhodococcus erythropolis]|uniref:3-hydroxyacyl-CoA dehydrogenase NAD-binding domain-containing protein n=1 Tax=Rhodococcus erythropolis TaxID=1833 RepID=UPI003817E505